MREHYVRFDEKRPPVTGVSAFERIAGDTVQQQAAVMLLLGQQLRGDPQAFRGRVRATRTAGRVELVARRDRTEFPVPGVTPSAAPAPLPQRRNSTSRP